MRIREIVFKDFRSFRGEKRISFVDPLTNEVRPITVIAGTNGSGKTTILDTIEAILRYTTDSENPSPIVKQAWETGLILAVLELDEEGVGVESQRALPGIKRNAGVHVAVGVRSHAPNRLAEQVPNLLCRFVQRGVQGRAFVRKPEWAKRLRTTITRMGQGEIAFLGGLLYFTSQRQWRISEGGPITPPPVSRSWIQLVTSTEGWFGSLEHEWVWQNYLDLEQGRDDRHHLEPFVSVIEDVLGHGRRITIKNGRVTVPTGWSAREGQQERVRIDELPSGEQQLLLLFGEIARRRRKGVVLMIDEPEISLHPQMQRLLVHQLRKFAKEWDAQVILATHSLEILRSVRPFECIFLDELDREPLSDSVAGESS